MRLSVEGQAVRADCRPAGPTGQTRPRVQGPAGQARAAGTHRRSGHGRGAGPERIPRPARNAWPSRTVWTEGRPRLWWRSRSARRRAGGAARTPGTSWTNWPTWNWRIRSSRGERRHRPAGQARPPRRPGPHRPARLLPVLRRPGRAGQQGCQHQEGPVGCGALLLPTRNLSFKDRLRSSCGDYNYIHSELCIRYVNVNISLLI